MNQTLADYLPGPGFDMDEVEELRQPAVRILHTLIDVDLLMVDDLLYNHDEAHGQWVHAIQGKQGEGRTAALRCVYLAHKVITQGLEYDPVIWGSLAASAIAAMEQVNNDWRKAIGSRFPYRAQAQLEHLLSDIGKVAYRDGLGASEDGMESWQDYEFSYAIYTLLKYIPDPYNTRAWSYALFSALAGFKGESELNWPEWKKYVLENGPYPEEGK